MPSAYTSPSDLDYRDDIDDRSEPCGCPRCGGACPCCDEESAAIVGRDWCAKRTAIEARGDVILGSHFGLIGRQQKTSDDLPF